MRKTLVLMLSFLLSISMATINVQAYSKKEMRAAWISTVHNIDWPSSKSKNNISKQKTEYINTLDTLKESGINTVILQVRPKGDALYNSDINPWSEYLTGTQGKYPGYDPLEFAIEEAHKRGMELHAWFNPYRVTTSGNDLSKLADSNKAKQNPEWVLHGSKNSIYNPGLPEVREYIVDTVMEVVNNYDIDGVHFDDYFYVSGINDDETYKKYGQGMTKDDWRRENVNQLLEDVNKAIEKNNSSIEFGVSPKGIWKNKSSDITGSDTKGSQSFYTDYADTRTWIDRKIVDYITPQLYWEIGNPVADYAKLVSWWSNEVKNSGVDLYIGQGIYKQGTGNYPDENVAKQITEQITLNRQYDEIKGSMFFSSKDIIRNTQIQKDLKELYKEKIVNVKPLSGPNREETAVEVSKEGWNTSNTVILVSRDAIVDGIAATPLSSVKDAPVLLTGKSSISEATKNELKRLNPSNVIMIGGSGVIDNTIPSQLKKVLPSANINRLGGETRYETCLAVANEIAKTQTINKVYVVGGYGEADALSIAAKAGMDKQPIILTPKDSVSSNITTWIDNKNISDAYFIGGEAVISDNVINQINKVTTNNVVNNRIYGIDRQETNAKVIEKFYPQSSYTSVLVTKSEPLVDALTAGPLAVKRKSPIVMAGNIISSTQKEVLSLKNTELVYRVGGGINSSSFDEIVKLIK